MTNKRPNILIFCTDEQRADHMGGMGHPHLRTPNMDRIAAEGTLFTHCYSSSPICMPARATMMTGLTNRGHGVVDLNFPLNKHLPTLPGMLAEAGYRTHAVGKLHFQGRGGRTLEDGEDITADPERRIYWDWPGHWKGEHYRKFPDNYYGFQTVELAQGHVDYIFGDYVTWLEENHPGVYIDGYRASNNHPHPLSIDPDLHYNTWIADRTIDFMTKQRSASPDQPFYVWCSFPDPHEPFAAVKKWSDVYQDVDIELPAHTLELSPHNRSATLTACELGTEPFDPDMTRERIRQTWGMISHVDEQIGRVLDAMDQLNIADDTIVMFISDHGDQLGEHGLFFKSIFPFDAHQHIPFIVKTPGGPAGKTVDDVVSMLDLVPTALDLASVAPLQTMPGEILTPVVCSEASPKRKNALVEIDRQNTPIGVVKMRTLVTNDWKLVCYEPTDEIMLFDRNNDPDELTNLAGRPDHQPVVKQMRDQLAQELARTQ